MLLGNPWIYLFERSLQLDSTNDESDDGDKKSHITSVAVCEHHDLIAVATHDGLVTVYSNDEKSLTTKTKSNSLVIKSLAPHGESYCSQLCWQAATNDNNNNSNSLLVAGRADGQIVYLDVQPPSLEPSEEDIGSNNDEVNFIVVNKEMHSSEIINLLWNNSHHDDLMHLLSVDKNGCCCLWKNELNLTLIPIMKYHNDSNVNAIVFLDPMLPPVSANISTDNLTFFKCIIII